MLRKLRLYMVTLVVFLAVDMVWLGLIAKPFYDQYLGHLLSSNTKWLAAAIFYSIFIVGILIFAVFPGLEKRSIKSTLLKSALFGLITYATYDLTNFATLKDWPLLVTLVDITWGTFLCTLVGCISYMAGRRIMTISKP